MKRIIHELLPFIGAIGVLYIYGHVVDGILENVTNEIAYGVLWIGSVFVGLLIAIEVFDRLDNRL